MSAVEGEPREGGPESEHVVGARGSAGEVRATCGLVEPAGVVGLQLGWAVDGQVVVPVDLVPQYPRRAVVGGGEHYEQEARLRAFREGEGDVDVVVAS